MTTRTEKIIKYLTENLGAKELHSNNMKYRRFSNPLPDFDYLDSTISRMYGEERFFWVGVRGAVRMGRNISSSMSVTDEIFKEADVYFDSLKWKTVSEAQKIVQLIYVRKNPESWNIFIEFQTSITSDKETTRISGYSPTYRALLVSSPKDDNHFPLSFIDIEISDEEMGDGGLKGYCEEIVEIIQKELPENQKEKVAILNLLLRNMDTYILLKEKTFLLTQAVNEIEKFSKKIYKKDGFLAWLTPNRFPDSLIDSDSWKEICQNVGLFSELYREFDCILGYGIEARIKEMGYFEDDSSSWLDDLLEYSEDHEDSFWDQSPYDEKTLDEARVSIVSMLDLLVDAYYQMLKSTFAFEKVRRKYRARKSIASDDLMHSLDSIKALFEEYFFSDHFDQDMAVACGFLLLEQFILELNFLDLSEIFDEERGRNSFILLCSTPQQLEEKFLRNVIKKNYYD